AQEKPRELKPGFNLFSKQQDVQLGRESAEQIEKELPIIDNRKLQEYARKLASRLWSQPAADSYPYSIQIVNDPSINAFALPGGPMFIHTGLIQAADNEAQVAGVLAHEISHVALRHGTNQASRANLIQLPAMLAGSLAGESMLGRLTQLGIGIGANSVLLKYSRNAERDADLLGTRLMSAAGFNPVQMASFFEKLEAEGGARGPEFFSSHPNPGNRVNAVQNEIRLLPPAKYKADSSEFAQIKALIAKLPPPPGKPAAGESAKGESSGDMRPSARRKMHDGGFYQVAYPDNWEVFPGQESGSATIAPRAALGRGAVGLGFLINVYRPQSGRADLQRDTDLLIRQIVSANPNMKVERSKRARWNGQTALVTRMTTASPFEGQTEIDTVLTVARPQGLLYVITVSPQNMERDLQPAFEEMLKSLRWR
ncbi:MAG: hypothetical protein FJW35_06535, partial [Acidobacteria bacterium]|nr:hypothetical protein [Acidobacteriota bacterium]